MKQIDLLRKVALSLPESTEEPHFEKTSFRVKKKIFVSYSPADNRACFKLSEIDQNVFATIDVKLIYPVPNKWGKQGWTFFQLDSLADDILIDALKRAYRAVAPSNLASQIEVEG